MFNRYNPIRRAVHVRTGLTYYVLKMDVEMKDTETRGWIQAVLYTDNVNVYCRERKDFLATFSMISD